MNRVEKIWRPCEDNPKYEVSFDGEVRNKKRGNILKKKLHPSGYYTVCLSDSGLKNGKWWRLHRLVAKAFIPRIEGKDYIDHIDGNRLNNIVSNLRWCSIKENCSFPLTRQRRKSSHQKYAMSVIQCDLNGNEIERYKSMNDAMRATGVRSGNISNNCSGYYKTAGGYIWKLANV